MKKRPLDRTKVVWRHLPPSITQAFLTEQIDSVFSGRYDWVSFRPGKSSQKRHTFSRAYIKFRRLEDVTEFAEFFNGHVFVNEKGAHFKTIVEYAPFQRVPAQRLRKDSREGTLLTGAAEGVSIVTTPLMDYVRRKRASKRSRRRGKLKEESGKSSAETRRSLVPQLNTEKRTSTTMCVLTDTARTSCSINKGVAGSDNCRNKKIQLSKRKVQQTHKVFRGIAPQLFQELHMTVPSAEKHDRRSEKHNLFNQDVHKRLPENRLGNEKGPPGASLARPYVRNANSASHVVVGNDLLRQRWRVRFN